MKSIYNYLIMKVKDSIEALGLDSFAFLIVGIEIKFE